MGFRQRPVSYEALGCYRGIGCERQAQKASCRRVRLLLRKTSRMRYKFCFTQARSIQATIDVHEVPKCFRVKLAERYANLHAWRRGQKPPAVLGVIIRPRTVRDSARRCALCPRACIGLTSATTRKIQDRKCPMLTSLTAKTGAGCRSPSSLRIHAAAAVSADTGAYVRGICACAAVAAGAGSCYGGIRPLTATIAKSLAVILLVFAGCTQSTRRKG